VFENSQKVHLPAKADSKETKILKVGNKKHTMKCAIRINYIYSRTRFLRHRDRINCVVISGVFGKREGKIIQDKYRPVGYVLMLTS
jgi:hypothetical protein